MAPARALVVLVLVGCTASQPTSVPPASGAVATPVGSVPSEDALPAASAGPSADLAVGGFAEVVVEGLQLRTGPAIDSPVVEGVDIALGEAAYIAERPVRTGDHAWYHVQLVDAFGWVAGGLGDESYLAPIEAGCPAGPSTVTELEGIHPASPLVCLGSTPVTLTAWVPATSGLGGECACLANPEWLAHPFAFSVLESAEVESWRGEPYGLKVRVDPASGVTLPAPGTWVEVTGQYDHPAASTCTLTPAEGSTAAFDAVQVVLSCREQFVVTAVQPIAAP